jgi:hypothetical protein
MDLYRLNSIGDQGMDPTSNSKTTGRLLGPGTGPVPVG